MHGGLGRSWRSARSKSDAVEPPPFVAVAGPTHPHEPLGHSGLHDHYIVPKPPTYVTEYEAAFKWPIQTSKLPI
jgi:hypothetical protein